MSSFRRRQTVSKLDERVWQLRNGIIQRLNNPEGLQEEEVDALICAAQAEGAEQERERIKKSAEHLCKDSWAVQSECFMETENEFGGAEVLVNAECYVIPASLLAPDKESEK
jgi:hypothetical protein